VLPDFQLLRRLLNTSSSLCTACARRRKLSEIIKAVTDASMVLGFKFQLLSGMDGF
jgi:hypothetical protein